MNCITWMLLLGSMNLDSPTWKYGYILIIYYITVKPALAWKICISLTTCATCRMLMVLCYSLCAILIYRTLDSELLSMLIQYFLHEDLTHQILLTKFKICNISRINVYWDSCRKRRQTDRQKVLQKSCCKSCTNCFRILYKHKANFNDATDSFSKCSELLYFFIV